MKTSSGLAIATAAAAIFATMAVPSVQAAEKMSVHCSGINSCKGTSQCKTATSACAGQNSCKGQGWIPTATAEECTAKGGKVTK